MWINNGTDNYVERTQVIAWNKVHDIVVYGRITLYYPWLHGVHIYIAKQVQVVIGFSFMRAVIRNLYSGALEVCDSRLALGEGGDPMQLAPQASVGTLQ